MKNWFIKNNNNLFKNLSSNKYISIYENNKFNNYNYLLMLTRKRNRSYKKNYNIHEDDSIRDSNSRQGNIVEKNLRNLFMYKFNLKELSNNSYFSFKFYYFLSLYKNNKAIKIFSRNDESVQINKDLKFLTFTNQFKKKNKILEPINNIFKDGNDQYQVKVEKIEFDMIATNDKEIIFSKELSKSKNKEEIKYYKNMNILFPEGNDNFKIPKNSIILCETKINDGKKEFKNQFLRNIKILNDTYHDKKKIIYIMFINSLFIPNKKLLLKTLKEIDEKKIDVYIISINNLILFDIDLKKKENYQYYFEIINLKEIIKENNEKINEKINELNDKINFLINKIEENQKKENNEKKINEKVNENLMKNNEKIKNKLNDKISFLKNKNRENQKKENQPKKKILRNSRLMKWKRIKLILNQAKLKKNK